MATSTVDQNKQKKTSSIAESKRLAKLHSNRKKIHKKKVKLDDLAQFAEQLAAMLEAGLPLVLSLEALKDQTSDPVFGLVIAEIRSDVSTGTSFSDALRKFPNVFPNFFISMVEAGEASGALAELMQKVAEYLVGSSRLAKKVKSALTYPAAVIGLAVVLVNVLLIFVIPVFADMFASFGAALPAPTQLLITVSNFLRDNVLFIIIALFVMWRLWARFVKTHSGRVFKDSLLNRVPIVGPFLKKIAIARFTRTYSTLLRAGVPILKAIDICGSVTDNTFVEDACVNLSRHITQGGQMSEVLQNEPYFPKLVTHMARAGEQAGAVETMMDKVANFFDIEVEKTVANLTSLLEPILIVTIGVIVGGIVMAMFLPIFQLSSVVGG